MLFRSQRKRRPFVPPDISSLQISTVYSNRTPTHIHLTNAWLQAYFCQSTTRFIRCLLGLFYSFGSAVHLLNPAALIKGIESPSYYNSPASTLSGEVSCHSLFRLFFLASTFFFSAGILTASGPSFLCAVDGPTEGSEGAAF